MKRMAMFTARTNTLNDCLLIETNELRSEQEGGYSMPVTFAAYIDKG